MTEHAWFLPDEAATAALAARWASALYRNDNDGLVLYLRGELGAGKTSFARALLGALGVVERIKSPTYSLLENYNLPEGRHTRERAAWHLDLYRIADPDELVWLGLDALSDPAALVLVEWPERGHGALVAADIELQLDYADIGRHAKACARSSRGEKFLARFNSAVVAASKA